ncbi:hypothetical protein [Shewanella algae]|uniref:Uncharacterized protein n=1 Tax=Shewanella algae TaxID=38313 RepID=A0A7T8EEZ5_9GAMM|nr:hypothetical protein D7032_18815 [Shewanella algae]
METDVSNSELILPSSYEEVVNELSNRSINEAMMDFFSPVTNTEESITELSTRIRNSGKLCFIVGRPGVGKSTFFQSISWRKHIKISSLEYFNAQEFVGTEKLSKLTEFLNKLSYEAISRKDKGPACIVINYLENLSGLDQEFIKGFFRDLNGILRRAPLLVLWPLTEEQDVQTMLSYSKAVSGTLFQKGFEQLDFKGPSKEYFCDIATKTIEVINGKQIADFNLNTNDLEDVLKKFNELACIDQTIRIYLDMVKEHWEQKSNYFKKIKDKIPKPNEVWFIFTYKNSEDVVKQFARQSEHPENAWMATHEKLYEYIRTNDQRKSIWDSQRLQLAINGALKTRILFISTNALIMVINSYSEHKAIKEALSEFNLNRNWGLKNKAQETLERTPLIRLLANKEHPIGKKKGNQTQEALNKADLPFKKLNNLISTRQISDCHLNKAISECINDCLSINSISEQPHPWIKSVRPDIFIETDGKQICLEFHYTDKNVPGEIADYVLRKLNIYMNQLEDYSGQKVLF